MKNHFAFKLILTERDFFRKQTFCLKKKFVPLFLSRLKGCQMVYFQTKNPNLGKFWSVLQLKICTYFMTIWYILLPFRKFIAIWYILWSFWYIFPVLVYVSSFGIVFQFWYVAPRKIWQPC
jgi:hypothetical protein